MSHAGRREGGGVEERAVGGEKEKGGGQRSDGERRSESDGGRLRARDKAPKEQLQKL